MELETYTNLINFLDKEIYPPDYTTEQRKQLRKKAIYYFVRQNKLFKRNRKENERPQRVVTILEREIILYNMHTDPLAGHFGKTKTIQRTLARYYWPSLGKDISDYISTCDICQRRGKPNRKEALHPLLVGQPFDRVGIDLIGPLTVTENNNRYIITATDYLTKWVEAKAIQRANADTTAQFIYEEIICRHGAPKELLSDRGANFRAEMVEELYKRMSIHHKLSSPYHPQTNGLIERFNRTLCETLAKITDQTNTWDKVLPSALFAYRTVNHDITHYEPFYLVYGRMARLPIELDIETIPTAPLDALQYQDTLQRRLGTILDSLTEAKITAYERIKEFQEKLKRRRPTKKLIPLEEENLVLEYRSEKENVFGDKFSSRWKGPFIIHQVLNNGSYILRSLDGQIYQDRPAHGNRLKLYHQRPDWYPMVVIPAPSETPTTI